MSGAWTAAFVALWMAVITLGFLVIGTLRRLVPVIERSEMLHAAAQSQSSTGLIPGTSVAAFAVHEIGGDRFTDADLRGSATILLFLGSSCRACEQFVSDLRAARVPNLGAQLVVIVNDAREGEELSAAGVTVLLEENHELTRVFETDRVPHAFVIDKDVRVHASGWPNNWDGLQKLVVGVEKGGGGLESNTAAAAVAL
jgi:AhpC/TSA family